MNLRGYQQIHSAYYRLLLGLWYFLPFKKEKL